MCSYKEIKLEIIHLSQNCEFICPATTADLINTSFKSPPKLTDSYRDVGIFWSVNIKMDKICAILPERLPSTSKKKPNATLVPVAQICASSTLSVTTGVKGLPSRCPNATPGAPCNLCCVDQTTNKKLLRRHCGELITTPGGCTQNVLVHWSTGKCLFHKHSSQESCEKKVDVMCQQPSIGAFFGTNPEEHDARCQAWETPCCGLNDETWLRPNAKYQI
ncbi:hypothetical protein DFH28DRAFT_1078834 [Melampsora americana]|nr:hypothetical protein DFH28DRAFT_1078834 [Melampsora americana]